MAPDARARQAHGALARGVFAVVVLVSLAVLFAPASDVPSAPPGVDKVVHLPLFAALAVTGRWAGCRRGRRWRCCLVGYAAVSEVVQGLTAVGRSASVGRLAGRRARRARRPGAVGAGRPADARAAPDPRRSSCVRAGRREAWPRDHQHPTPDQPDATVPDEAPLINVGVLGARGRMGTEVAKAVNDGRGPRARRDGRRRRLAVRRRRRRRPGGRGLHPPGRRHGQHPLLHRPEHPLRRRDDGLRRGQARHHRRVAGAQARGRRGHRPQLRHRRGAAHAVRPGGGPVLPVGRGRRAAPPGQGRRPVRHRRPHRPPGRRGPPGRRPARRAGRHRPTRCPAPAAPTSRACPCTPCG